ncbi:hypothetical protein [Mangrovivirga cuniculi]|uniref:Type II toxin-antitoxin system RelE/ParE family toxin n=1 Tax=Mangrovivirga cuniculi TaxID=2715131 RepID=A0A4D7JBJ9_9BACT|nr:hypothetical protein [Mangrovivirga cuniculi]QCK13759.1 hypothetical protein DCC35_02800 [Mangrovivirga cuniculi]
MKVIYTNQSLVSLEESLRFLKEKQELPPGKIKKIKTLLFDKAESLVNFPETGQIEEYLEHLELNHRRIIDGANNLLVF